MSVDKNMKEYSSKVDPSYSGGGYFSNSKRGAEDAPFKARWVTEFVEDVAGKNNIRIESYADVGCGAGEVVRLVSGELKKKRSLKRVAGYDVSPHVSGISMPGIEFIHGDFCGVKDTYDLVTLLDVFEHVPETADFIKAVASRAAMTVFHIPLDDCLLNRCRDEFRKKLVNPGHLIYLNTVSALNLLALSGLRVLDYRYTFAFEAPSGRKTLKQKIAYPFRKAVSIINPWLLSSTIGGTGLLAAAVRV